MGNKHSHKGGNMARIILSLVIAVLAIALIAIILQSVMGSGAFKRKMTLSGIYAICQPEGYPVVCFGDAGSKEGGIDCVPLTLAGGKCH